MAVPNSGSSSASRLEHRRAHELLELLLVRVPVRLRVVGLEPLVELDRLGRPAPERHAAEANPPRLASEPVDGVCVWLTGRRGSGKTTVGRLVANELGERGVPHVLLDEDEPGVRVHLQTDEAGTPLPAIAWLAVLFSERGVVAIVSADAPGRAARDDMRGSVDRLRRGVRRRARGGVRGAAWEGVDVRGAVRSGAARPEPRPQPGRVGRAGRLLPRGAGPPGLSRSTSPRRVSRRRRRGRAVRARRRRSRRDPRSRGPGPSPRAGSGAAPACRTGRRRAGSRPPPRCTATRTTCPLSASKSVSDVAVRRLDVHAGRGEVHVGPVARERTRSRRSRSVAPTAIAPGITVE